MDQGLSYDDVLLKPQKSHVTDLSSVDTSVEIAGLELSSPVLSAAMDTVTELEMASKLGSLGGLGVIHRFMTVEEQSTMVEEVKKRGEKCAAAVGLNDVMRASSLVNSGVDALVVDIAHGHHSKLLEELEIYSDSFPGVAIVAGNVATREAACELEDAGADILKVGIGPGSACTTREMTGAGVPQFSAVRRCASEIEAPVIADGGIRKPGDLVKALMAGASAGMIGGMFAGTRETPGDTVEEDGKKYKIYRGMSSEEAAKKRAEREGREIEYADRVSEGVVKKKEFSGSVEEKFAELIGGLRSGISYCGADNLREARLKAEFIEISESTQSRNGSHIEHL